MIVCIRRKGDLRIGFFFLQKILRKYIYFKNKCASIAVGFTKEIFVECRPALPGGALDLNASSIDAFSWLFVLDVICMYQHFSYCVCSFICIKFRTYWYNIFYSSKQVKWIMSGWCSCSSSLLLISFPLCDLSSPGVFQSLHAEWCPWCGCPPRGHCCLHFEYFSLPTRSLSRYHLELKYIKYP